MCVRAAIVHIIYSKMGIDQMPNFKTNGKTLKSKLFRLLTHYLTLYNTVF